MSLKSPKYSYAISFGLGVITLVLMFYNSPFLPDNLLISLIYLSLGILMSTFWQKGSWKLGLWLSVPIYLLIGFSVLFTGFGKPSAFLQNDLPPLLIVLVSSCLGGFIGPKIRNIIKHGK